MDAHELENLIKKLLLDERLTITELARRISEITGKSESVQNLGNKLRRGSLRYVEASDIAQALGYDIVWKKREGS